MASLCSCIAFGASYPFSPCVSLGLLSSAKITLDMVDMRLTVNETTGEHTCVMLRELQTSGLDVETKPGWLEAFTNGMSTSLLRQHKSNIYSFFSRIDFKRRIITLLGFEFRRFSAALALAILKKEHYVELDSNTNSQLASSGMSAAPH